MNIFDRTYENYLIHPLTSQWTIGLTWSSRSYLNFSKEKITYRRSMDSCRQQYMIRTLHDDRVLMNKKELMTSKCTSYDTVTLSRHTEEYENWDFSRIQLSILLPRLWLYEISELNREWVVLGIRYEKYFSRKFQKSILKSMTSREDYSTIKRRLYQVRTCNCQEESFPWSRTWVWKNIQECHSREYESLNIQTDKKIDEIECRWRKFLSKFILISRYNFPPCRNLDYDLFFHLVRWHGLT